MIIFIYAWLAWGFLVWAYNFLTLPMIVKPGLFDLFILMLAGPTPFIFDLASLLKRKVRGEP